MNFIFIILLFHFQYSNKENNKSSPPSTMIRNHSDQNFPLNTPKINNHTTNHVSTNEISPSPPISSSSSTSHCFQNGIISENIATNPSATTATTTSTKTPIGTNRSNSTRNCDTNDVSPIQLNDNSYFQKSLQKYDYRRPIVGPNG